MSGARIEAVMLLGPTASGKSQLAMSLAQSVALEIISVDSAQVYRELDIGTAKASRAERSQVPHHLIDIRDPKEPYSAADFVHDATPLIASIGARGRLPLLVGGTMMYAKALRHGISALPSADVALRAKLEAEAAAIGWPAMHERLSALDPATAARLKPNDAQRIQRALEIIGVSGQPMSALLTPTARPAPGLLTIALVPADRAALHQRIERRFDAMLAAGLLDEVRALKARGDLRAELPAIRSVGYRQAWQHLEGATSSEDFRAAGIAATRQLAKRQMTWLRSMEDVKSIEPFAPNAGQLLLESVRAATLAA